MFNKLILVLALWSCSIIAAFLPWQDQITLGIDEARAVLRPATDADLDDFVDVYIEAFKPGPLWQYIMSHDKKYEEYTWNCTRRILQAQWEERNQSTQFINVIVVPEHRPDDQRSERVVSIAAWEWEHPDDNSAMLFSMRSMFSNMRDRCSENLDTNMTRLKDLSEKLDRAGEPYFGGGITEMRLWLALLATHPDWDGHGFGAAHVEVGLQKAANANKSVELLATPAGYPLYDSLGFRSIGNITVEMLDGLGILWQEYMHWTSIRD